VQDCEEWKKAERAEQLVHTSTWPQNLGFGPSEKRAEKLTLGEILEGDKHKGKEWVYT
jgi:hypothetical protein